ncbi:MAG: lytic transglycosylase domain-containing protein [Rhodobacteraceae bacterium]|nr:lytic transglycosylase domain-containing protein [Paracoccaceae bacterium]
MANGLAAEQKKSPPPFKDFSSKRVGLPKPGQKRITVQIGAEDVAAQKAPSTQTTGPSSSNGSARYDWFWDDVSPEMAASGPGRLDSALRALSRADIAVGAPRLQQMQDLAQAFGIDILRSTVGTEVSPALVLAVMMVESSGRSDAVSGAGAQGLMQLIPATADRFGVKDALKPAENIAGGVKYLNWLMGHFDRDPVLVLAGYNAGEGAVRDHAGVPPYPETRDYVPKVLAAYQVARGLCLTLPELITDGCVFTVMR